MSDQVEWRHENGQLTPYVGKTKVAWTPQPGSQELFLSCPIFECLYEGTRGPGKGLPLAEPVLTPLGFREIQELQLGSKVSTPDGGIAQVIGVFPQGERETYEIEFDDGAIARCDDVHIWPIHLQSQGTKRDYEYRLASMQDVLGFFERERRVHIPTLDASHIQRPPRLKKLPLDPYLVGLLLGDGCTGQVCRYCTVDEELAQYAVSQGMEETNPDDNGVRYFLGRAQTPVGRGSRELGIVGKRAWEKSVHRWYKQADAATRLAVLQGLMDTDGTISRGGDDIVFSSCSRQLAEDVQWLARSLGGKAKMSQGEGSYNGKKTRMQYGIRIQTGGKFCPFRLSRKVARFHGYQHDTLRRRIIRISPLGKQQTVCIKIDHPLGLFVTRDFVVTHNTDCLLMDFAQHTGPDRRSDEQRKAGVAQTAGFGPEWRGILFRQSFPELADVINKTKKWFPLVCPGVRYNETKSTWIWPTGEMLLFRHGRREDDYWNYHGHAYPWVGFEELTTWADPGFFRKMMSCCRSTHPGVPRKFRATTNPYGCVPYGDVLTVGRGWVPIQEMTTDDEVVSVQPNGDAIPMPVTQVIRQHYDGTMIRRRGAGLHMTFTEDHRLPLMNTARTEHVIRPFHELPGDAAVRRRAKSWQPRPEDAIETFTPPDPMWKRQPKAPDIKNVPIAQVAALLGWFVSEGSCRGCGTQFEIAQQKLTERDTIRELLGKIGFRYTEGGNGFQIYGARWARWLESLGESCREKQAPSWLMLQDEVALRAFFDAAMAGDGSGNVYYSQSRILADQMAEVGVKLGYAVRIGKRQPRGVREKEHVSYEVSFLQRDIISLQTGNHRYNVDTTSQSVNIEREHFSGDVFCLTVPGTETFFVRQNGCVWLSGNSGHNWVKQRYNLPVPDGQSTTDIIEKKGEPPRVAVRGYLDENQILLTADPSYKDRIRAAARNAAEERAWLHGAWDIVAGGMFDDVWEARIHIVPPFRVPSHWRVDRSMDWGSSRPFSIGWWAESDGSDLTLPGGRVMSTVRGDLFRIREWYGWTGEANVGLRLLPTQVTKGIIEREIEWGLHGRVVTGPADSAIFDVTGGESIAAQMGKSVRVNGSQHRGIRWNPADKRPGSRKHGWELMRMYMLGATEKTRERPGLFVCENCQQFIRTVPVLPRNLAKDPDDVLDESEDHVGDEARYRVRYSGMRPSFGRTRGT